MGSGEGAEPGHAAPIPFFVYFAVLHVFPYNEERHPQGANRCQIQRC